MSTESAAEALAQMQAAMDRQNAAIAKMAAEHGRDWPGNVEALRELQVAQGDFREASEAFQREAD